jgi:hypothetical protein
MRRHQIGLYKRSAVARHKAAFIPVPLKTYPDSDACACLCQSPNLAAIYRRWREKEQAFFLKQDPLPQGHITTHYIWHTQDDAKVRASHAANNGKIFAWNDPPPTGHPSEDFGCRCWAEPYVEGEEMMEERRVQTVTSLVSDLSPAWTRDDFLAHYYAGKGTPVTLSEIGHLQEAINYAQTYDQPAGGSIFERFENQICEEAKRHGEGNFPWSFKNRYDYISIVYSIGEATFGGSANVDVVEKGSFLIVTADIKYFFYDRFKDPYDVFNIIPGEIEIGGVPYDISGNWEARVEAYIKKDKLSD